MSFHLKFTDEAAEALATLRKAKSLKNVLKAVQKCLGHLETNPRHPGLNTHKFSSLTGLLGEEVFEAYAQNRTPGAYRVFWHYGPGKKDITIVAITPHP